MDLDPFGDARGQGGRARAKIEEAGCAVPRGDPKAGR